MSITQLNLSNSFNNDTTQHIPQNSDNQTSKRPLKSHSSLAKRALLSTLAWPIAYFILTSEGIAVTAKELVNAACDIQSFCSNYVQEKFQ